VRQRRLVLLLGLLPVLIIAALAVARPGAFVRLDNAVYDIALRLARAPGPSSRVVIVDVDERSLSTLGQWPWRRDLVATLIERLRGMGASIVALDIVFAEADRDSLLFESRAAGGPGTPDDVLASTLAEGRVILGYGLTFDDDEPPLSPCVLHPLGVAILEPREGRSDDPYFRATGAVCNLPMLARAVNASGFLNAAPDADGILRRVPLVAQLNGRLYPGLALAAVTALIEARHFALRVASVNDSFLSIDDRRAVPLDGKSNLLLRYRGEKRTFPYVSAVDVVNETADAALLRDKIVFVGTTALGTREVVGTPLDTLFPGVEVQATVADNLLQQDFIDRSAGARLGEVAALLGLGGLAAGLVAATGVVSGLVVGVAGGAAVWFGSVWLLSTSGVFVSPLFPTLAVSATLAAATLATFGVEHRRADRAGRDATVARRLMVQTLLSLTAVRDAETGSHSLRTQRYARLLAEALSTDPAFHGYLTRDRIDLLSSLAPLHDIGKVGVPDHILNKPGMLTPEELAEMRKHPTLGREVILQAERRVGERDDETLAMAKDIVYTHHERWDGTGYPQGLRGTEIPVAGRVMAVVDVYDAAVTRSLYRHALPPGEAVRFIVEGKGTLFDPAVVEAFVRVAPEFRRVSDDAAGA
jgi:adenylate cyclase